MRRAAPLLTLALVACSLAGLAGSAADATSSPPLRGTNWVLTDRVSIGTPLDGVGVDAVFDAKRVTGWSGCNGYSRSYSTRGARMTVENDGVSTLIACEGAPGKVEPRYLAALNRVGRWRITGNTLTLSTRTGRRVLVYRASIGAAALRGRWVVTSFYTGSAVSSPIAGTTLTLEVAGKDASGDAGCNTFSGPVEFTGVAGIALGPFAATLRACADPAQSDQEREYLAALGLARTYRATGDTLTLLREGDTVAATFQRES